MTIKQFCAETGEKYQTVYHNVKKYRDNSLAGHIRDESGESMLLDDYAVYYLMPREMLLEKLLNKISFLSDSYESTRKTAHHYKAEYEKACKTSGDLTSEKLVLQKELSSMQESRDDHKHFYESERAHHERTKHELERLQRDYDNIKRELSDTRSYCKSIEEEAAKTRLENNRLINMINAVPVHIRKKYSLLV